MSRGLKERTPAQLAVLAQAREKAKLVIAERAKLNTLAKKAEPVSDLPPEPVSDPPEHVSEDPLPPSPPSRPPPREDPTSESEDEEPRPKYRFVHGVGYIKIK